LSVAEMEAGSRKPSIGGDLGTAGIAHKMLWMISPYWFETGSCRTQKQFPK